MTATSRPTLRHVPALDGLRGLAVAAVVAFHAGFGWAAGGYLGVSAFFTLSGYLITSLLLVEWDATGGVSLRGFWSRRFRRLLPAALAVIAGVVALAPFLADSGQIADLRGDVLAGLGYMANWRFVLEDRSYAELFAGPSPLQHLWSLAIEEQFYVFFPLVIVGLLRFGRGRRVILTVVFGLLTVASMAWMWRLGASPAGATRSYYDTGARAAELLIGALLAVLLAGRVERVARHPRTIGTLGAGALVALTVAWAVVPQDSPFLQRGGFVAHALLMALVLAAAHVAGPVRSFCSTRPLRLAGRVSYGVYLIHWPVFVWMDADRVGVDGPILVAMQLSLTLLLTAASYHLVEQPVRIGRALPGVRGITGALACGALVVAGTVAVGTLAEPRDGILALDQLAAAEVPPPAPEARTLDVLPARRSTPTTAGAAVDTVDEVDEVLLLGDSVMSQALDAHVGRFAAAGVRASYAGGPGTGPLSPQGSWGEQVDAWVSSRDPDVVVIEACCNYTMATDGGYVDAEGRPVTPGSAAVLPAWEREIRGLIERAGVRGARVALVRFAPVKSNGFYGPIEEHVAALNDLYDRLVREQPGLEIIDWGHVLAPEGTFTWDAPGPDGTPTRVRLEDGVHLTPAGSALVAETTVAGVIDR